jgi:hypothetical protein
LTGSVFNLFEVFNETVNDGSFHEDSNMMTVTSSSSVVPEPSSFSMMGIGLVVVVVAACGRVAGAK